MPDPEIIRVMRAHKAAVAAGERAQMEAMSRRWLGVERRLSGQIEALALQMEAIAGEGGTVSRNMLMTNVRYRELLIQLHTELNHYTNYADRTITNRQEELGALGIQHSSQAITVQGVTTSFNKLPVSAVEHMAGVAGDGSPLRALLVRTWPDAAEGLTQALVDGVALGWGPRKTARAMAQGMTGSLNRMLTIARTEQLRVYKESSRQNYQQSGLVTSYKRLSTHDRRTCLSCLLLEGTVSPLDEVMASHPNCVIGGTLVSASHILSTSKRAYDGPVFEIVFEGGNRLTVTPNHPILTNQGWIAAYLLKEGDYAVGSRGGDGAAWFGAPNNEHGPSVIEDIVAAFGESFDVSSISVPIAAEDFHGDGQYSDVAVIGANRLLQGAMRASLAEIIGELPFFIGGMSHSSLLADSPEHKFLFGASSPFHDGMGGFSIGEPLFGSSLSGHQAIGLGAVSNRHIGRIQATPHCRTANAISARQSVFRFAGSVGFDDFFDGQPVICLCSLPELFSAHRISFAHTAEKAARLEYIRQSFIAGMPAGRCGFDAFANDIVLDRVLQVSSRYFSGHVYNLQTDTGWYVANGIITHNCRCTMVPIVRGAPEPDWLSGEDWLMTQDSETQINIMGKGTYEGWRMGKFELGELVTVKPNAVWGDTLQVTPLRELV